MTTLVECGDEKRHSESACYFDGQIGGMKCDAVP
jgi:hypothetical protein